MVWNCLSYFVALLSSVFCSFEIERLVDSSQSGQPDSSPFYSKDIFKNPVGCSILWGSTCRKLGASCTGFFSCCYCECKGWTNFVSLANSYGCKEGKEFRTAVAKSGLACHYLAAVLPGNHIPTYNKLEDLQQGFKIIVDDELDSALSIDMNSEQTFCTPLRLFYVNRNANERLIIENPCGNTFDMIKRKESSSGKIEWFLKWQSSDTNLWKSLNGKLLKAEVKCTNSNKSKALVSCVYFKVHGRYDDEKTLVEQPSQPCTTVAPATSPTTHSTLLPSTTMNMTSSPALTPSISPPKSRSQTMPVIIGTISAGILLVFIIIIMTIICVRRRRLKSRQNTWDVSYQRPIVDDVDKGTGLRYQIPANVKESAPQYEDGAEYEAIDVAVPSKPPVYASADIFGKNDNQQHPEYQASSNPYYRPATEDNSYAAISDSQEKLNLTYVPSLPRPSTPIYDDPAVPKTFGGVYDKPATNETDGPYYQPSGIVDSSPLFGSDEYCEPSEVNI